MRADNRGNDMLRNVQIVPHFNPYAEGSCLIKCGNTHVICTATVEEKIPSWLEGKEQGWITAEYAMLPRATSVRNNRETLKPSGRSQEIKRLIGRALRAGVDLAKMPHVSIIIDCDVIQADGGTRTASVTGGFVALYLALESLVKSGKLSENPVREFVAAVSCGICAGQEVLDEDYMEDSNAQADTNFVLTESGKIVEIQGTAEQMPFDETQLLSLLHLAKKGIQKLIQIQKQALGIL